MKDLPTVRQLLHGLGLTAALSGTVGCEGKRAITKPPPPELTDSGAIVSTNPPPTYPPDASVARADATPDVADAFVREVNQSENPPWVPDAGDGPSDRSPDVTPDLRSEGISVPNPPWPFDARPDGT
jgi:hypothetical protein